MLSTADMKIRMLLHYKSFAHVVAPIQLILMSLTSPELFTLGHIEEENAGPSAAEYSHWFRFCASIR
jgi:hypothetical protein